MLKPSAKIRTAVIGAGIMGKNHIRTYAKIPDVKLVAIAEIDPKKRREIAAEFFIRTYGDYKRMLTKEKPDVVSICVSTSFHYPVAKYVLLHGFDTLLEKPITGSLKEGKELIDIAAKNQVHFLVGHIERHNPAVVKVKSIIEEGKLGKIISIIARRVGGFPSQIHDADIAVDLAIHDIDIVNFLLGELPKNVHIHRKRNHIRQRDDSVEFFLEYPYASAFIQANWISPVKIRKLNITGTEGYLEMDYITQQISYYKSNYEKFKQPISGFSDYVLRFSESEKKDIDLVKKEPLKEELIYFIHNVKKNRNMDSSFAVDALKIALTK